MKTTALLLLPATVGAFTVAPCALPTSSARVPFRSPLVLRESAVAESETGSALESVYEQLGIEKDELAMGVNPAEVLQWIGT